MCNSKIKIKRNLDVGKRKHENQLDPAMFSDVNAG